MSSARSHAEEQVLALDEQERVAALTRDATALERLWSDEFVVDAPNDRVVIGRRAVLDTFVHSGVIDFSRFDRDVEFVRADAPYVVVMGLETVTAISSAPSAGLSAGRTIRRRFTNLWRQEGATWRLYLRHANVMPDR